MKKILLIALYSILSICCAVAKNSQPSWVTNMPSTKDAYIGIASEPITTADYRDKARLSAINDIASQISVNVESSSFMRSVDIDGDVRGLFDQKIKESLSAYIGGHELMDSYESETHYYVYYKLGKDSYNTYIEAKRKEIIQLGLDYLAKGKAKEQAGDLVTALSLYTKGMVEVEPYLNLSLDGQYNGRYVNVATELYTAYKGIFSGMALTSNMSNITVEAFSTSREPIAVCLSKSGAVIPNVTLKAEFVSGEGELTPPTKSDYTGTAIFYLTNVTSKDDIQSIKISIDDSVLSGLSRSYRSLIESSNLPEHMITVAVSDAAHTAYFDVGDNDIPQCESQVRSIFASNYFEISEDPDSELYIIYSTTFNVGREVDGELYKMNECLCTMNVKIYNNYTQSLLGEYTTSDVRVLVPIDKSYEQTMQMCAREMMKRYKVGLPAVLKKIKL